MASKATDHCEVVTMHVHGAKH